MIREEFADFVELWNSHRIRPQRNRPHVISGIPMDLYRTDKVEDWGIPFEEDDNCGQVLRTMLAPLESIEIDEFMTPATTEWCIQQLEDLGFDQTLRTEEDRKRPFLHIYIQLREHIQAHIVSGQEPLLELTSIPVGGTEVYVRAILHFIPTTAN